tara:strand:- start:460 stop:924 length:465 start_codon:yes stop_codon:yes gene_type:complete
MKLFNKVVKKLINKDISTSVAESCTGGLLSSKITSVSGVSKIFYLGLVVYSNQSKSTILNIPSKFIFKYGAVSSQLISKALHNLHKKTKSKLCICTTGIAGPTGGSKNKPVGLVFIGIRYKNKNIIIKKNYKGTRKQIQNKTVQDIFKKIDTLI